MLRDSLQQGQIGVFKRFCLLTIRSPGAVACQVQARRNLLHDDAPAHEFILRLGSGVSSQFIHRLFTAYKHRRLIGTHYHGDVIFECRHAKVMQTASLAETN